MRMVLSATALAMLALPAMAQDRAFDQCLDHASDQRAINQCGADQLAREDAELNRVYRQVLERHPQRRDALVAAQRAWLKYRDAELAVRFPDDNPRPHGSNTPLCAATARAALTRARTAVLRQWLDATEGDVCALAFPGGTP